MQQNVIIYSPIQCMLPGEGKHSDFMNTMPSGVERNMTCAPNSKL
jgi:hypothetical protein